ncbi:NUC188 domain-containing protein [Amanita rubescens]|nr:NUC188 domain-containing protein [Amanita rubescens]
MAQKRKDESTNNTQNSREKKRQKLTNARTIAVQSLPSVASSSAGPSTSKAGNSMDRLPSTIDVEKFTEARAFEINAMEEAMKNARESATHRVWQTLPRHLRRRAASHDVRRVPVRLRSKARAEMDPVKKTFKSKLPKRGKTKQITRTESFARRQRDKLWLETHIWHAKRMKMEDMWGYRLAVHPTEKSFRSSHRASVHGSIIHDASYTAVIEVKSAQKIIENMLMMCCDPQRGHPAAKRNTVGSRTIETHLYRPGSYPFDLITPITILWRPMSPPTSQGQAMEDAQPRQEAKEAIRIVWLMFHPVVYDDVSTALQHAAKLVLDSAKQRNAAAEGEYEVEIADLRGHFNIFELMGPKTNQVLKGVLKPVSQDKRESFIQFWSSLNRLPCSGSFPRNMIVGFKVVDPRLNFPPKNARSKSDIVRNTFTVPSEQLAQSEIWDEGTRLKLKKPRYKKMGLDQRRSKNLIPGTPLQALRQDDRIPILLIQHSLESSLADSQSMHGWKLIIPAGWSMAFFNSLVFTGTRVGGQRERQTQSFEAGTAYYPRDYPFTQAYALYASDREKQEKERWKRRPPAKRVNYTKLGIRSPWRADWEVILGLEQESSEELVPTQREDLMDVDNSPVQPWLLQGPATKKLITAISDMFDPASGLSAEINTLRMTYGLDPLSTSIKNSDLLKGALVSVAINMWRRGTPEDMDTIHIMNDDEVRKWTRCMQRQRAPEKVLDLDDDTPEELELAEVRPSHTSIIGYITTGQYSLSRSKGYAIGAVSLSRFLELEKQITRYGLKQLIIILTDFP